MVYAAVVRLQVEKECTPPLNLVLVQTQTASKSRGLPVYAFEGIPETTAAVLPLALKVSSDEEREQWWPLESQEAVAPVLILAWLECVAAALQPLGLLLSVC